MAPVFARILLAFDDSAGSWLALEYACRLAGDGATLTVAHAVDEDLIVSQALTATGFAAIDPRPLVAAVDERGSTVLQSAVDACAARGISAQAILVRESAALGIAGLEHAVPYDLIIVGTHGRQGFVRLVLGSIAEEIIRSSTVPVLVVSGHTRSPKSSRPFERALVGIDESAQTRNAVAVAARFGSGAATHLVLCHVIDSRDLLAKAATYGYDPRPFEDDLKSASLELLQRASADFADVDDIVTVEGEPAAMLEHTAMQRNCDLVIIGSHVRRGLGRLMFGSVAQAVIHATVLPVLVIPSPKQPALP